MQTTDPYIPPDKRPGTPTHRDRLMVGDTIRELGGVTIIAVDIVVRPGFEAKADQFGYFNTPKNSDLVRRYEYKAVCGNHYGYLFPATGLWYHLFKKGAYDVANRGEIGEEVNIVELDSAPAPVYD
jgi:hypothetical protein